MKKSICSFFVMSFVVSVLLGTYSRADQIVYGM